MPIESVAPADHDAGLHACRHHVADLPDKAGHGFSVIAETVWPHQGLAG
jgi:hypothetical protein